MKHRALTGALASTVLATTSMVGLAAAPAQAAWDPCDLRVKLAEVEEDHPDSNIVIYREGNLGSWDVDGFVTTGGTRQRECYFQGFEDYVDYGWVVFDGEGEFVRSGDGGFRNWAYTPEGAERESDTRVTFAAR